MEELTKHDYIKILIYLLCKERKQIKLKFPFSFYEDYNLIVKYVTDRDKDLPSWEFMQREFNCQDVETTLTISDTIESLTRIYVEEKVAKVLDNFKTTPDTQTVIAQTIKAMQESQDLFVKERLYDLSTNMDNILDKYETFINSSYRQYKTGLKPLDDALILGPGTLNFLCAGPAAGKSLTLNHLVANMIKEKLSISVVSLEMPVVQCMNRLLTDLGYSPYNEFKWRRISKATYQNFLNDLNTKHNPQLRFITREEVKDKIDVNLIENHLKVFKPQVLFIDYLQLMDNPVRFDAEFSLSARLKTLAMQYECCIICAVQASPGCVKDGRIPELGDSADFSGINRDCDSYIGLRGSVFSAGNHELGNQSFGQELMLEFALRKNRDGEVMEFKQLVCPNEGIWRDFVPPLKVE